MRLQPGAVVGPYQITAHIGSGGMGDVYRARDPKLQRDVAIKVLPEAFAADPDRLARFEREALAVAALSHPGILAIHDFGRADGVTYAVMELLEGETLRAASRRVAAARAAGHRGRGADRAGARGGARQGHRAPRHQAGERVPHERRAREGARFRPGAARRRRRRLVRPPCPRRRGSTPRPGWCSARPATCRPSRSAAAPSITARTSFPSAS